jgi:energy-coupling factor transport system ATP-binding protein
VLILDEPTAGQDFAHYTEFMDFLRTLNAAGTTVVLITHDMHLAVEYTDRVLVLSDGRLLADAHPARVLTDPGLTARADLVVTGLYDLARRCGIEDPHELVRRFVAVDRERREAGR